MISRQLTITFGSDVSEGEELGILLRDRFCAIFCLLINAEIKARRFTNTEVLGRGYSLFRKLELSQ